MDVDEWSGVGCLYECEWMWMNGMGVGWGCLYECEWMWMNGVGWGVYMSENGCG